MSAGRTRALGVVSESHPHRCEDVRNCCIGNMKLEGTYSGIPSPATLRNEMAATMIAEAMFNLRDILEAKWISAMITCRRLLFYTQLEKMHVNNNLLIAPHSRGPFWSVRALKVKPINRFDSRTI